ncbi:MAG: hypothetical protein GY730_09320 [bacterium]|nr:hypothetical protein [bacterium]
MNTVQGLQIKLIGPATFQKYIQKKRELIGYGYPDADAELILAKASRYAARRLTPEDCYYSIMLDGTMVSFVATLYKKDCIFIPYMFVVVPQSTNYGDLIKEFLRIGKMENIKYLAINTAGVIVGDVCKKDIIVLRELGFIEKRNGIHVKYLNLIDDKPIDSKYSG